MPYYKCPSCMTFAAPNWGLLKGHLTRIHKEDLKDAKAEAFADFEISEEEYNKFRPPSVAATETTPTETEHKVAETPVVTGSTKTPPAPEIITEYVGEPVARLRQVLLVNGGSPGAVNAVTLIMSRSRWLWGNPYELETLLIAHFGQTKKDWVRQCVAQYIRGVELPDDVKGMSPYIYAQGTPYGQTYGQPNYGYPLQGQPMQPPFGQPMMTAEVQELRAEVAHLREERQREHEQQLLNRIAELEKRQESGQGSPLMTRLEAIEKKLEGSSQSSTMTIYDEKGNPMVLPYDRSYMVALNRKQEVETEAIRTAQMIELLKGRGDSGDKYTPLLEALKKEQEAANRKVEELTKSLSDQRIGHLEERIKAAEELALSSGGEGKGVLEFAAQAGADIKEGAAAALKEVGDRVDRGVDTLKEVITNRPAAPPVTTPRSPQEIADIMETENAVLHAIGEQ